MVRIWEFHFFKKEYLAKCFHQSIQLIQVFSVNRPQIRELNLDKKHLCSHFITRVQNGVLKW